MAKLRCTLNFITNVKGDDVHIQLIGSAKCPRCFPKSFRPWEHFHIDYYSNETSWMQSDIFFDVLKKFSHRMQRMGEKRVILVMDNFWAHMLPKDKATQLTFAGGFKGFQYQNVVCLFLPPKRHVGCPTPRPRHHCGLQGPLLPTPH